MKRYATHDYDSVLELYYAKARFYDAHDRRFTAVDPIKGDIRNPMTLVQYLYVKGNPIMFIDVLGEDTSSISADISVALLFEFGISIELVSDDQGGFAVAVTHTVFGGGVGLSAGLSRTKTNAQKVDDLEGLGFKTILGPITVSGSSFEPSETEADRESYPIMGVNTPLRLSDIISGVSIFEEAAKLLTIPADIGNALAQVPEMGGGITRTYVINVTEPMNNAQSFFHKVKCKFTGEVEIKK